MQRTDLLRFVSIILLALFVSKAAATTTPYSNKELTSRLIVLNDNLLPKEMARQLLNKESRYYGALFDDDSVVSPIRTAHYVQTLMCSYVSPPSKYYRSTEVLDRMILAARALRNLQHEDGTIDLLTTNFHSTPDLGFTILPLATAYSLMLQNKKLTYGELPATLKQYLVKAGEALSTGGIHTPNHRWVVSAALAWLYGFFHEPKYKARIDQWLAEKIDIDPDGQYHERSTSIYTPVTNRCLIDIAKKMKYDFLYDAVRKNLDLTFYFVHSNGEIATESSRRQDKYIRANMSKYYLAYNQMALLDKDKRYAGMVRYIQETVPDNHLLYMLPVLMDEPALLGELPSPEPLPTNYHKHFTYSDMVRVREGNVDMSLITDNSTFLTFFKGQAGLEAVRLSAAFFGKGQFISEKMETQGDTYVLSSTLKGPYYQPLPKEKIPADVDAWSKIPRTEREQSNVQTLATKVFVTMTGGKARVRIFVDGPENLPVTLELGFREGGKFANVTPKAGVAGAFLPRNGEPFTYEQGGDRITVGPGVVHHKWVQLRGALPKLQADCVYFTNYAPCEFEFTIE